MTKPQLEIQIQIALQDIENLIKSIDKLPYDFVSNSSSLENLYEYLQRSRTYLKDKTK